MLFDAVQPPAGEVPVVLLGPASRASCFTKRVIGHGMEADFNRKKTSTFSTMIGKKVAEPFVFILDDGTVPNLLGSINVDDEGTPDRRPSSWMAESSRVTCTTGSRRSFTASSPRGTAVGRAISTNAVPRMRNTYMTAGPAVARGRHQGRRQGYLCPGCGQRPSQDRRGGLRLLCLPGEDDRRREVGRAHQGRQHHGERSEDAARTSPWRRATLSSSLGGGGACGKDGQSAPVGFGLPTCLVKSLTVGGTKGWRKGVE